MNLNTIQSPLLTDLYELTMAAGYWENNLHDMATFSLFLREIPKRGYYVAAGLALALEFLENFRFSADDIAFLAQTNLFKASFLDYLRSLRFKGDIRALPEGTLFFPNEPILEVTAPIVEAQLVETFLVNIIGMHTMLATKAARCVYASQGRVLIDFALRRTQGADAGLAAARSSYLAGFEATSNVLAAQKFSIPAAGTMAHSFIQVFDNEQDAFEAYARTFPDGTVLLIDTYDTLNGAHQAVKVARVMAEAGHNLLGVRLDSGDMIKLSHQVRRIFDEAKLPEVKIVASGGFDEFSVEQAVKQGAAIDIFGVGTKMGVSADLPYLDLVYKLVRYNDRNVRKLSSGKKTLAGEKQIFRYTDEQDFFRQDTIGLRNETVENAQPLLETVMCSGRCQGDTPSLKAIRHQFKSQFDRLPDSYKRLSKAPKYPVKISPALADIQKALGSSSFLSCCDKKCF